MAINGYVLTDNDINNFINNDSFQKFKGNIVNELNIGKLVIKQKNISDNLDSRYNNYLYIFINSRKL